MDDDHQVQLASVTDVIVAPVAAIWDVLTDFAHPQRLAATIEQCRVKGDGIGAVRVVQSSRGRTIHERLVECDPVAGRFRYEILDSGDMPFAGVTRYDCTVTVSARADGSTAIAWASVGSVDGPIAPVEVFLTTLYARAIDNIRAIVMA